VAGSVGGAFACTRGYPEDLQGGNLPQLIKATFVIELTLNWLVTGLIAYRLYTCQQTVARATFGVHRDPYTRIILGIIESGAIISATSVVLLVLWAIGNNALITFWFAAPKIIGMTLTATVLILNIRPPVESKPLTNATTTAIAFNPRAWRSSTSKSVAEPVDSHELKDVAIESV